MIRLTATQFAKIWNELPNPNRCGFRENSSSQYYKMMFLPELTPVNQARITVASGPEFNLVQAEEIEFKLNIGRNGYYWEPVKPILITEAQ